MEARRREAAQFIFQLLDSFLEQDEDQTDYQAELTWREMFAVGAIVMFMTAFIAWAAGSFSG